MGARRVAAIALTGALVAGGTGAAIAAVTKDDATKAEQAILDDAAKRLDVTPEKLREALAAAQDAQLDEAVQDGTLTRKQADAIKAARERSGRVLGGPFGRPGLHGGPGERFGPGPGGAGPKGLGSGFRGLFADLADALGTTPARLFEQLRSGTSVAAIAKANGKSLDDVRTAVKAAAKKRLDKAVTEGDITRKQADALLDHVDERLRAIESGRAPRRHRGPRAGKPSAGAPRPGGLLPGEGAPEPAPPGNIYS